MFELTKYHVQKIKNSLFNKRSTSKPISEFMLGMYEI